MYKKENNFEMLDGSNLKTFIFIQLETTLKHKYKNVKQYGSCKMAKK